MKRTGLIKLTAAFTAALLFGLVAAARYDGDFEHLLLTYVTPIIVPFVAVVFDQLAQRPQVGRRLALLDAAIVGLSMLRAVYPVPLISGHSLFLTYALLRSRSRLTQALCLIVFAQVAYFKLAVWHDATFWGGLLLGIVAYGFGKTVLDQRPDDALQTPSEVP